MKGIILAGGEGRRLQPLGLGVPKPLIPVKKKPLLNYNLSLFSKHGVNDVKVLIRPMDKEIYEKWYREYKKEFSHTKIDLVVEPEPMGTFGYMLHHLRTWAGSDDVFVTNGDDIKEIDLVRMLEAHRASGAVATVALMRMDKPDDYGAVLVRENRITSYVEKQRDLPPGLVSSGMYIISPSATALIAKSAAAKEKFLMFEKDLFPVLAKGNDLGAFVCEGGFYDCGTPERLEKAIREV